MLRSSMIGLVGVIAGLGLAQREASACSIDYPPAGYVQELKTTLYVSEDETSPRVCTKEADSCGPSPSYRDLKAGIVVTPTTDTTLVAGKDNTWLGGPEGDLDTSAIFTLKDAAGKVLEEQSSNASGAIFTRLGATVCVKTATKGNANPNEVCSPVTVTSLDISAKERSDHDLALRRSCGDDAVNDLDGGCNTTGGATSAPIWLALGSLVFAARRRRRK